MRSNATLKAAQKTSSVTPYVPVWYYTVGRPSDGGGEWVRIDNLGGKARVIEIDPWVEETYNATATIRLHNEDSAFDAYNLLNKWIRIGRGIDSEVSYPPYLKCIGQDFYSRPSEDEDVYAIYCEGAWNILERFILEICPSTGEHPESVAWFFNQPDLMPEYNNKTIKQIIDFFLEKAGLDLGADIGTLDGKITTWKPQLDFFAGENGLQIVKFLLELSGCVLLPRTDCMHPKFCQDGDAVDYTYKVPQDASYHPFISGQSRSLAFKPMKAIAYDKLPPDNTYSGEYADPDWVVGMGYLTGYYPFVTSDADCEFLAEAYVKRAKSNAESGMIFTPIMNCLQELYDKVTVTDGRGNISGTGRVGGIYAHYRPGHPDSRQIFNCEIRLGGLQRSLPDNMQSLVDRMSIGMTGGLSGQMLLPHSIPADALRQATQPYTTDITFDTGHADYTWEQVKWLAGTIMFQDETELDITAGTLNISSAYPGSPDTPVWLYFIEGNSTMQHTQNRLVATKKGRGIIAVVQRAEDASHGKAALFYTGGAGKVGLLNATIMTCDYLSAIVADMGLLTAGEIRLGSGTPGVNFTGIRIYKSNSTYQVAGYNNNVLQGYIDSDGKIKAGAGAVILSADGLTVKGQLFILKDSDGNIRGYLYGGATALVLSSFTNNTNIYSSYDINLTASDEIYLIPGTDVIFNAPSGKSIYPATNNFNKLGWADYAWDEVHCYDVIDHTPHIPIPNPGFLEEIRALKIDSKGKLIAKSTPAHIYRPATPEKVRAGQATDGVSLGNLLGLALGGLVELESRIEALEAR